MFLVFKLRGEYYWETVESDSCLDEGGIEGRLCNGDAIVLAKELCEAADLLGVEESEIISVFQFVE